MLAVDNKSSAAGSCPSRPLPLENGDFMHSREFLRRYEGMPELKKAELIGGVVYLGSPAGVHHGKRDALMSSDAQGVLCSRVFRGLRLPVEPLLAFDTAKVLEALAAPEPPT
jgi:hypothetical protein